MHLNHGQRHFFLEREITSVLTSTSPVILMSPQIHRIYQLNELARLDPGLYLQRWQDNNLIDRALFRLKQLQGNPRTLLEALSDRGVKLLVFLRADNFTPQHQTGEIKKLIQVWQPGHPHIVVFSGHRLDKHLAEEIVSGSVTVVGQNFHLTHQPELKDQTRVMKLQLGKQPQFFVDNHRVIDFEQDPIQSDFLSLLLLSHPTEPLSVKKAWQILAPHLLSISAATTAFVSLQDTLRRKLSKVLGNIKVPILFTVVNGTFQIGPGYVVSTELDDLEQALNLQVIDDPQLPTLDAIEKLLIYKQDFMPRVATIEFRRRYAYAAMELNHHLLTRMRHKVALAKLYKFHADMWLQLLSQKAITS